MSESRIKITGPSNWDNDEYIDAAMENEAYESSYDDWGMTPNG